MKFRIIIIIITLLFSTKIIAQSLLETNKIVASNRAMDDFFGFSSIINNNQIIVGAYGAGTKGRVYVFDENNGTWTQSYTLYTQNLDYYDYTNFGKRIIIDNNNLIISSSRNNSLSSVNTTLYDSGEVYIYNQNSSNIWEEHTRLSAQNPIQYGNFGFETGIHNNILAVSSEIGNVNIFEFNTSTNSWEFVQELITNNGTTYLSSVNVWDNKIAVGIYESDENGMTDTGAVYIFEKDTNSNSWNQIQKILSPSISTSQRFGKRVYLKNNFLYISSVYFQKVFIYKLNISSNQYEYLQQLGGENGFGQSICVENNFLIIGANGANLDSNNQNYLPDAGAAYLFEFNTNTSLWDFTQKIVHSDRDNINWFGSSVSINNNRVLFGAPYQDKDESNSNHIEKAGAVYLFDFDNSLSINSNKENHFTLFPNPATDRINFKTNFIIKKVEIFDLSGKLIKTINSNYEYIPISDLEKGTYIVKIQTESSNSNFKIIKN